VILKHLRILANAMTCAGAARTCGRLVEQWELELHNKLPAPRDLPARAFRLQARHALGAGEAAMMPAWRLPPHDTRCLDHRVFCRGYFIKRRLAEMDIPAA